jgi:ATP-dependent Clp protease ATP-binding subunit ClpC
MSEKNDKMTSEAKIAFKTAYGKAKQVRDEFIRVDHIIYGIIVTDNIIKSILDDPTIDYLTLVSEIETHIRYSSVKQLEDANEKTFQEDNVSITMDDTLKGVIKTVKDKKHPMEDIDVDRLFLEVYEIECGVRNILLKYNITKDFMTEKLNNLKADNLLDTEDYGNRNTTTEKKTPNSKTPVLDAFSIDLTDRANKGKLDPVVGREYEIERVCQIIVRKKKNNPVLIGEPGVGKTAVAEGLAIKIASGDCPSQLKNKRVVNLELTSLVAGTKYRGQFEERIKSLIDEVKLNPDVILFIDELHTLIGTGNSSGSLDAANILKPALARGELQCIGATTLSEYMKHIEKDGALERRFQKVMVEQPTLSEVKEILVNVKNYYEKHHNVTYTDDAIDEIVRLSDRYITGRNFPDKALDVMDEAGAKTQIKRKEPEIISRLNGEVKRISEEMTAVAATQQYDMANVLKQQLENTKRELATAKAQWDEEKSKNKSEITAEIIAEVVSKMTNIPIKQVTEDNIEHLLQIENELKGKVIGQDEAVIKLSSAIKRNSIGLRKKNGAMGTFMFVGSTGVGKTLLTKLLAEYIFYSADNLIRIDMSEFMEKHTVSRLIGAPPGYVGYEEGGELTEKVKNKPYSIILFDEIEKAHKDVFNILLQVLDEGFLTDRQGKKVDFRNTLIIMTSNIGAKKVNDFGAGIGFVTNSTDNKNEIINKELKAHFRPEFLNRIDEIIHFNRLSKEDVLKITNIELKQLQKRMLDINHNITFEGNVDELIFQEGYNDDYGAREINRTILRRIENPITDLLIQAKLPKKSNIVVYVEDNGIKLKMA